MRCDLKTQLSFDHDVHKIKNLKKQYAGEHMGTEATELLGQGPFGTSFSARR